MKGDIWRDFCVWWAARLTRSASRDRVSIMKQAARIALLFPMVVFLASCASVRVSEDYDPDEDFSGYQTFTWLPVPQKPTGDYRVDNPLLDTRIRAAVERNLGSRGYRKVEDRAPDFYVAYHLGIEQKLSLIHI